MSISSVSSASALYSQTNQVSPYKQAQTDFTALSQALASGNLTGAQQAYAAFQNDMQALQSSQATQPSAQATPASPNSIQGELGAVGQALKSGNLTAAQNAFASLQQGLQNAQQGQAAHGRHHHHHGGGGAQSASALTSLGAATQTPTSVSALTGGSSINTTA